MLNLAKLNYENKTYKIKKILPMDTLEIAFNILQMFSSPILSVCLNFINSSIEEKKEQFEGLSLLIGEDNGNNFRKEVFGLLSNIKNNFKENCRMLDSLIGEINVEETISNEQNEILEIKEYKVSFKENFNFDDLDLWIDLIILAVRLNFETGLRKSLGKLGILDKMN
jgi:hypothetical protein